MKLNLKSPDQLEFNSEDSPEFLFNEDEFLIRTQKVELDFEKLKSRKQDRKERKRYAKVIFRFIIGWCSSLLIIMLCTGLSWFKFDNSVIITLLTTTTANILALFVIVANYLFFRDKKNNLVPVKMKSKKKSSKIVT